MAEQPKPQFPDVRIKATAEKRSALKNIGDSLMPTEGAVSFSAKSKYEAAAAEPPCTPCPAPKCTEAPGTPINTDARRAVEADIAKQMKFEVKSHYPSVAHLVLAQL